MGPLSSDTLCIGFLDNLQLYRKIDSEDSPDSNDVGRYYSKDHDYSMQVPLVNGKPEGEALLYKNSDLFMRLEYKGGEPNGVVEKMNNRGEIVMRGHLYEGSECGLFREYDKSVVTWIGHYNCGERFTVLAKSAFLKGYYEERYVEDGDSVSVAQYDDDLQEKNGYCIESEDDKMEGWIYENGIRRPVGDDSDERKTIEEESYHWKNTLTMRSMGGNRG